MKDLHFQTGRDAKGFPVFRGEPGKVKKFLTSLTGTSPDVHRARELFAQYLDGAAAVAKTGERDAPAAARRVQEATRRLRKAIANAQAVSGAAERTATRTAGVDVGAGVAAAGVGAAVAGPMGLVAGPVARGFHLAEWLGRASKKLGLFAGDRLSMEKLLAEGALSELGNTEGHEVAGRLADDLLDGTPPTPPAPAGFRPTPPPAGPGAAVRGERGVALEGAGPRTQRPEYRVAERVDARMEPGFKDTRPGQAEVLPEAFNVYEAPGGAGAERATAHPGVGQARRAAADRPAGMEAIQPQPRPRSVGAEPPVAGRPSFEPGESDIPSIRDGSEVPLANPDTPPPLGADALAGEFETVSAPYHTEGMSESEKALAPGAAARSAEAARLQALTEGEFKDIVDQLGATGSDEARAIAKTLWANKDKLAAAGLLVASGVDALTGEPGDPNVAGASAGVLGAALLLGKRAPGAWFAAARPEMQKALGGLERLGFETTPAHVAMLAKTFGDRVPSEAVLQKMIPLGELEKLAPRGEAPRLVKVGGAVHWYAEGVSTVHPEWGFEAPTWKMARTFERAPDGELIVHHDYFYLREDLQGTGAGAKILKDQMEAYRELGVDLVEVSCDDVGKYFWPSIGFNHPDPRVVQKAVNAYQNWVVQNKLALPSEVAAEAATIKSLPRLAQAEFGKDFLLAKPGEWNLHLEMKLSESNPLFHLMSQRLSLQDAGLGAAGLALAGAIDGSKPEGVDEPAPGAALAPFLVFGRRASMLKGARARLVADVAKRLFTSSAPAAARVVTRLVYSRSEMAKRQQEFETWQANPQELVDRVAEGFREVPPEQAAEVNAGVFRAASFLKARLPRALKASPVSMRAIPVSTEQLHKFARYEQAALAPRDALQEAAHAGHLSTELLETLDELYPDLLAETRVAAYQAVREDGPPPTVQARLAYAQLFDGNGEMADPAFGAEVARMSAYAYENAPPAPKGSAPSTAHVSQVAAANARPAGLARLG